jgi:hypothetical protein
MKKIRTFISRLRWLWRLPERYARDFDKLTKEVNQHVTCHVDLHMKEPSIIIAIGRFRKRDYVRIFRVDSDKGFHHIIEMLQAQERHAKIGRIDTPYGEVRAVFDRHFS